MKFSTSINIERDSDKVLNYVVTANAKQSIGKIVDAFNTGIHSFCLIGSYGTGKSSFLLALQNCLSNKVTGENVLIKNIGQFNGYEKFNFVNIVGDYTPLIDLISSHLPKKSLGGDKNVFAALDTLYKNSMKEGKFLVIVIDEFGKVLEHAAKNNPEKEMYFLQKFCEYVNDTNKNILLLTTLHQGFNAYAKGLKEEQKQEWNKVKGRISDIVFKEPIEQLLNLTAIRISEKRKVQDSEAARKMYKLAVESKFVGEDLKPEVCESLYPMDIFAAYVLTLANQRYGQNERTLFTFLEATGEDSISQFVSGPRSLYNLAKVHDYIVYNFHSYLNEANADSANWSAIKIALERTEGLNLPLEEIEPAIKIVKTIGLLNIFASSAAVIDNKFIGWYAQQTMNIENALPILKKLEMAKIIRYAKYKSKYILFEGTDVDIEMGLYNAAIECKRSDDFIDKLRQSFDFKVSVANAHYYKTGTPRYFEYLITSAPIDKVAKGDYDGNINLVFPRKDDFESTKDSCMALTNLPIAYCLFKNANEIIDQIFEIDKLIWVKNFYIGDDNDKVAHKEIDNLISYEKSVLNRVVLDSLYSNNVEWIFNGSVLDNITGSSALTKLLSTISDTIYYGTPVFKNELINKPKPSSTMSVARQNYLLSLLEHKDVENIGFPSDKFPPEKSIYLTMVKNTGIHSEENGAFSLAAPKDESFAILWDICMDFLKSAQSKQRKVGDLAKQLASAPLGLKRGFIDCWLPTFLIIKKDDFALYSDGTYIPFINREVLELIQRNPNSFTLKAFNVEGVKQVFFDKYREAINLKQSDLTGTSFIETIRPFLTFYKRLNAYARTTKDISTNAKKFRDVIAKATDPEETFFEVLPEALGFKEVILQQNPEAIESFVEVIQNSIRDLRSCYDEFVKAIEKKILSTLKINEDDYTVYKPIIENRYKAVKTELMPIDMKNFHARLTGKYADRKTWIEAVCYSILSKALENIKDGEKDFLFMSIQDRFFQLDDYVEMHKLGDEEVIRLHITQNKEKALVKQVLIPKESMSEVERLEQQIEQLLSGDDSINMAALMKLIKKKM